MTLLEEVKTVLRVKSKAFDDAEISPLISSCKADLLRAGIKTDAETDPLTRQAIKLYCKANFGFSEDSEKFQKAYEALRDSMALSGDYGGGGSAIS